VTSSSCAENSLIDSKEFFKPVITPYELELALVKCVLLWWWWMKMTKLCAHGRDVTCRGKEWTGEYVTDFSEILPSLAPAGTAKEASGASEQNDHDDESEARDRRSKDDEDEDEPRLSLIDGKLKSSFRPGTPPGCELTSVRLMMTLTLGYWWRRRR
jgi:diphthamide biosynthesis protein 2